MNMYNQNACMALNILFFINFASAGELKTKYRCDYEFDLKSNMFWKVSSVASTWHEAEIRCQMEGAILASPKNIEVTNRMTALMTKHHLKDVFVGIHSMFSRGDLQTIEGIPYDGNFYRDGNDQLERECYTFHKNVISCNDTLRYICYKERNRTVNYVPNDCGTTDNEYKLNKETGSCYKVHGFPRTWSRAFLTCEAEGGYLTIINSLKEAVELGSLFSKHKWKTQVGDYVKDRMSIGFHDWDEHGEWRTINGMHLTEAGYNGFKLGFPQNATPGQFCGAIGSYDGVFKKILVDQDCNKRAVFICEKNPHSLICD